MVSLSLFYWYYYNELRSLHSSQKTLLQWPLVGQLACITRTCGTTTETGLKMKRSEKRKRRSRVGGKRRGKEREGEEKLAMLPNCTWVVQISSGTIFLCNTSHHNVAKRHDTAWHHHTTLSAQHRPFSHIYVYLLVCRSCVVCVLQVLRLSGGYIVLLDSPYIKQWAHRHQTHSCVCCRLKALVRFANSS